MSSAEHFFHWAADPVLIDFGPVQVRWYGLLFAAAFIAGFHIVKNIYHREQRAVQDLDSMLFYIVAGTIVGARLGHCLIYDPGYYLTHPLEILKVWQGGLASHGGAAGILVAVYLYARKHADQPYIWLLDRLVIPSALGGALIRLGNFFNSEILGNATDVPWGIVFTRVDYIPRHPVQLYESLTYLGLFILLWLLYLTRLRNRSGVLLGVYLTTVFSARFGLEYFKAAQAAYESGSLSVGQWLSVPLVVGGIILLVRGNLKHSGK